MARKVPILLRICRAAKGIDEKVYPSKIGESQKEALLYRLAQRS